MDSKTVIDNFRRHMDTIGVLGVDTTLADGTTIFISKLHDKPEWKIWGFRDYPYSTMAYFEMCSIFLKHDFIFAEQMEIVAKYRLEAEKLELEYLQPKNLNELIINHRDATAHHLRLTADALEFTINYFDEGK